jgi:predicted permease
VLALGVSAPTVMFSILRGLAADVPVSDVDRLFYVGYTSDEQLTNGPRPLTGDELRVVQDRLRTVGALAAYRWTTWDLGSAGSNPERITGAWVSYDLLGVLGEAPLRGRGFVVSDSEAREGPVAIVDERLWRERFGSDPDVVGSEIRLDGVQHTIVGVLPAGLHFPLGANVWVPIPTLEMASPSSTTRYGTLGRLPNGTTIGRIEAELAGAMAAVPTAERVERGARFAARRYLDRPGSMSSPEAAWLRIGLMAFVGCLLLVACANVANLLLCRAVARQQQLAVRIALGAGRARIVAHHLTEACIVAVVGGVAGLGLASGALSIFRSATVGYFDSWIEFPMDAGVLAFAAVLIATAALVAGTIPAIQATSRDVEVTLRGDARTGGGFHLSRLSEALVVAEVALSTALLVPACYMVRSTMDLRWVGDFETQEVLVAGYTLRDDQLTSEGDELKFHQAVLERAAAQPGVVGAALAVPFPGSSGWLNVDVEVDVELTNGSREPVSLVRVSPGVFDLIDAPILRGRDVAWTDGVTDPPSIVVNEAFALRFFPGADPLGKEVRLRILQVGQPLVATIVGVAPPLGVTEWQGRQGEAVYVPITVGGSISGSRMPYVMLRAERGTDPLALLPQLRQAIATLDPDKPLESIGSLDALIAQERRIPRVVAGTLTSIGLAGLLMAGTGLFSVMAFAVGRRTREVGVRVALGANPGRVAWAMIRDASIQLGQGLALGLILACALAPAFPGREGQPPRSPAIYALVVGVLLVIGLIAAAVPTLRAIRVEPTVALRTE